MHIDIPGRQVQRLKRAYLFGHYDSRGGATLVVDEDLSHALVGYAASLGLDEQAASDVAEQDYVARFVVLVCDQKLSASDDGAELLAEYRDTDGYRWGVVQSRWRDRSARRWSKWEDVGVGVLWMGDLPVPSGPRTAFDQELRIVPRDVGEDAWGLGLIWAAPRP